MLNPNMILLMMNFLFKGINVHVHQLLVFGECITYRGVQYETFRSKLGFSTINHPGFVHQTSRGRNFGHPFPVSAICPRVFFLGPKNASKKNQDSLTRLPRRRFHRGCFLGKLGADFQKEGVLGICCFTGRGKMVRKNSQKKMRVPFSCGSWADNPQKTVFRKKNGEEKLWVNGSFFRGPGPFKSCW